MVYAITKILKNSLIKKRPTSFCSVSFEWLGVQHTAKLLFEDMSWHTSETTGPIKSSPVSKVLSLYISFISQPVVSKCLTRAFRMLVTSYLSGLNVNANSQDLKHIESFRKIIKLEDTYKTYKTTVIIKV